MHIIFWGEQYERCAARQSSLRGDMGAKKGEKEKGGLFGVSVHLSSSETRMYEEMSTR